MKKDTLEAPFKELTSQQIMLALKATIKEFNSIDQLLTTISSLSNYHPLFEELAVHKETSAVHLERLIKIGDSLKALQDKGLMNSLLSSPKKEQEILKELNAKLGNSRQYFADLMSKINTYLWKIAKDNAKKIQITKGQIDDVVRHQIAKGEARESLISKPGIKLFHDLPKKMADATPSKLKLDELNQRFIKAQNNLSRLFHAASKDAEGDTAIMQYFQIISDIVKQYEAVIAVITSFDPKETTKQMFAAIPWYNRTEKEKAERVKRSKVTGVTDDFELWKLCKANSSDGMSPARDIVQRGKDIFGDEKYEKYRPTIKKMTSLIESYYTTNDPQKKTKVEQEAIALMLAMPIELRQKILELVYPEEAPHSAIASLVTTSSDFRDVQFIRTKPMANSNPVAEKIYTALKAYMSNPNNDLNNRVFIESLWSVYVDLKHQRSTEQQATVAIEALMLQEINHAPSQNLWQFFSELAEITPKDSQIREIVSAHDSKSEFRP